MNLKKRHTNLQFESLEGRRLLAVDLLSELDIEEGAIFTPRSITGFQNHVIVRGNDGRVGPEAWITEGTPEDFRLLKDIRVGEFGSGPREFVEFNNRLFFSANNGFNGYELWVSSGTKGGTDLILDIWPGLEGGAPTELTVFNDHLYFFANDGETGRELYRSDGTPTGTMSLGDLVEGRGGTDGEDMMVIGDRMFFQSGTDGEGERGIWVTDGTTEGTKPITNTTLARADIDHMMPFGTDLVFTVNGSQLWISDGTDEGTRRVEPAGFDLPSDALVAEMASARDRLYVASSEGLHEISSDLAVATLVSSKADGVTSSAGRAYFWNQGGLNVVENGSATQLMQFQSFFGTKMGTTFGVENGLLFNINKTLDRHEIWATNGTKDGTFKVEDIRNPAGVALADFQQIGDSIYFAATNGAFRESLWAVSAPTIEAAEIPELPGVQGDVNGDGAVNVADIDALHAAIAGGTNDATFDLNGDAQVTTLDADFLIEDILGTKRGDVDLNGRVDFLDFLALAQNFGKQEATWSDGDFDGDGSVSFLDFLSLAQNFGSI